MKCMFACCRFHSVGSHRMHFLVSAACWKDDLFELQIQHCKLIKRPDHFLIVFLSTQLAIDWLVIQFFLSRWWRVGLGVLDVPCLCHSDDAMRVVSERSIAPRSSSICQMSSQEFQSGSKSSTLKCVRTHIYWKCQIVPGLNLSVNRGNPHQQLALCPILNAKICWNAK